MRKNSCIQQIPVYLYSFKIAYLVDKDSMLSDVPYMHL